jgi:hypothetical protein
MYSAYYWYELTHPCSGAFAAGSDSIFYMPVLHLFAEVHHDLVWGKDFATHLAMMGWRVVFCPVIRALQRSWPPVEPKLFLIHRPIT